MSCSGQITEYLKSNDPDTIAIGIALLKSDFHQSHELTWDLYYELIHNKALYPSQFPYSYSIKPKKFIVSSLVQQLCEDVIPKLDNNAQAFTDEQIDEIFDEAISNC